MFNKKSWICLCVSLILTGCFLLSGCHRDSKPDSDSGWDQPEQGEIGDLKAFKAFSVEDEVFTQEYFDDYQVTVVVFWAPWSDASVYELQRFDQFVKRLPDRVGFITVGLDNEAKTISSTLKTLDMDDYTTLITGDQDFRVVCDQIENVPTTIFVDHEGTLVGGPVIGIQKNFEETYLGEINKALKAIGKKKISLESSETTEDSEESDQE